MKLKRLLKLNQQGFGHFEAALALLVIVMVGFIGIYISKNNNGHAETPSTVLAWRYPPRNVLDKQASELTNSEFGADIVNFDYTGWGQSAEGTWPLVNLGNVRIWDDQTTWADVEPSPGVWDFSLLDQQVNEAQTHNAQIIYVLGQTPLWASSNKKTHDVYGYGEPAPPSNISTWAQYVTKVATRYKGKINTYEVWDEADASTFSGTPAQMVQLAQIAYSTIKGIDPGATVLTPSFTQVSLTDSWLANYLKAGGGVVADGLAAHAYAPTPGGDSYYAVQYRAALTQAGLSMPIWMDELGYQGINSAGQDIYTSSEAQSLVAQTILDVAESGVAEIGWYGANSNEEWLSLGEQGYPKDAQAYSTMVGWLVGSTPTGCGEVESGPYNGLTGCYLRLANGSQNLILWAQKGTLNMNTPPGETLQMSQLNGSTTTLKRGSTLTLNMSPILLTI